MAEEKETGLKWWVRYAIVPLIGGGGIIAILVAVYEHRTAATPPTASPTATTTPTTQVSSVPGPPQNHPIGLPTPVGKSDVSAESRSTMKSHSITPPKAMPEGKELEALRLYATSAGVRFATDKIWINKGESVTLHWNIPEEKSILELSLSRSNKWRENLIADPVSVRDIVPEFPMTVTLRNIMQNRNYAKIDICFIGPPKCSQE